MDALEDVAQLGQPSGRSVRVLDVGNEPFLDFFKRELLDELIAPGGATCRMFEGPYGSGKSHLLFLLREAALDRDLAVVHTDLSAGIQLEDWPLITQHILQNLELRTPTGSVRSLPRILEAISGRATEVGSDRGRALPHPGFERAMRLFLLGDQQKGDAWQLLERFLLGERVGVADLRRAGVAGVKHPLNRRNAQHVLRTVAGFLLRNGVRGTLLLFDENEEVFKSGKRGPTKRVQYGANLLRRLIDATASGGLEGTAAIFATLPGFLASCAEAYPALGQRVELPGVADDLGWRSPVLPVRSVAKGMAPETFLEALIDRIVLLAGNVGAGDMIDAPALRRVGDMILSAHAGDGYRRELMKAVASHTRLRLSPIAAL